MSVMTITLGFIGVTPGNEDSKLHKQSTGGCVGLELSIIFKRLHITFSSEQQL
jgi:hypothetical protein